MRMLLLRQQPQTLTAKRVRPGKFAFKRHSATRRAAVEVTTSVAKLTTRTSRTIAARLSFRSSPDEAVSFSLRDPQAGPAARRPRFESV